MGHRARSVVQGGLIVGSGFLILTLMYGTLYSFGVFLKPLVDDLHLAQRALSGAYSLCFLLSGILAMPVGRRQLPHCVGRLPWLHGTGVPPGRRPQASRAVDPEVNGSRLIVIPVPRRAPAPRSIRLRVPQRSSPIRSPASSCPVAWPR